MFLGFLLLGGLLYCYFSMLLGPLDKDEDAANATIRDKSPQVETDKETIKSAKALKAGADAADATLDQIKSMIPNGSQRAWFPPLITEFFNRQGIDKISVRYGDEGPDKDLAGFKRGAWGLDITHVEIVQLALSIAAFENEHPLMEIDSLQIEASKDSVQYQTARMNVSTVIKQ